MNIDQEVNPRDKEAVLKYFRQDVGVNLCYYYWHIKHPFDAIDKNIVNLDRRGEQWYYFHQQILARYNAERFCNNLPNTKSLCDVNEPIEEAYFPEICTFFQSISWPPRVEDSFLYDVIRPNELINLSKHQIPRWIDRIVGAIESGKIFTVSEECLEFARIKIFR